MTRHIFSFSCIQPCNPVGRYPTIPSSPNQTPNTMLIITMHSHPFHAMSLCICNAMCHFMLIPCHIYDECYMDNSTHAYNPWTIISISIKFPNDHTSHVNIFAHTYINIKKSSPIKQCQTLFSRPNCDITCPQMAMQWPYPYTNSSHVNTLGQTY